MRIFSGLCGILLCTCIIAQSNLWDTPEGRERIFEATIQIFTEHYWKQDYINWENWGNQFRTEALTATSREDFDKVMRRMVSSLNDQHSAWLGKLDRPSAPVLERSLGTEHSYLHGTGLVIENVLPQSPAQGILRRGDVIVRINGTDVRDSNSYDVAQLIGEALNQTEVSVDFRRKQRRLNLQLSPRELNLTELKNLPQSEMLSPSLGYIYLPTFTQQDTAQHFHQHLKALQEQGATGLILDLRDNPGGGLGELGLVMCAFLREPWVQATQRNHLAWTASCDDHQDNATNTLRNHKNEVLSQDGLAEAAFFEGPIVVLVSRNNNSAGEVAALVLQHSLGATIVGEKTQGNVEALQEFTLSDQSVVLVAVANLQGIQGHDFSLGVRPDIESQLRLSELARGFDAPLAEAIKVMEALPFTPGKYF